MLTANRKKIVSFSVQYAVAVAATWVLTQVAVYGTRTFDRNFFKAIPIVAGLIVAGILIKSVFMGWVTPGPLKNSSSNGDDGEE